MSFWSVVVKPPADPKNKIQLDYLPALIFLQTDSAVKGIAVFSTQENAQGFLAQVSSLTTFEVLCVPLHTAADVDAWRQMLTRYLGPKKCKDLPVYLDPPDTYCKGVSVPLDHKNLRHFITRCMPKELDPLAGDVVAFQKIDGGQVVVCQDSATKKYAALVRVGGAPDDFDDGAAMIGEYLELAGTTDEKYWRRTNPVGSIFTALSDAKEAIK